MLSHSRLLGVLLAVSCTAQPTETPDATRLDAAARDTTTDMSAADVSAADVSVVDGAGDSGRDAQNETPGLYPEWTNRSCTECVQRRCGAMERACASDDSCRNAYLCVSACRQSEDSARLACVAACRRGHSLDELQRGILLGGCYQLECELTCGVGVAGPLPNPAVCRPPQSSCDPANGFSCCVGAESCVEPAGRCCRDGYCAASGDRLCNEYHPCVAGSCMNGRCVVATCGTPTVACRAGWSCCDTSMVCGHPDLTCCLPSGAEYEVAESEAFPCCSNTVQQISATRRRCA